jgi:hypothetical protein
MSTPRLYGCWNREPFATHYKVGVRTVLALEARTLIYQPVMQLNTASKSCNYTHDTLGQSDTGCTGCKHKALK